MGYTTSAYHFYGVHVPKDQYASPSQNDEIEMLDWMTSSPGLDGTGLGYLTAGLYDQHELFLCVIPDHRDAEVGLGDWRVIHPHTDALELDRWEHWITDLAGAAGYKNLGDPGWVTVPSVD